MIEIVKKDAGTHFDPKVVQAFLETVNQETEREGIYEKKEKVTSVAAS